MEQEIIDTVMVANNVTTSEIPQEPTADPTKSRTIAGSKRYFETKAFASFDNVHEKKSGFGVCSRSWKSAHAWCVLDLKNQCIAHKLTQDCQACNGQATPHFDRESVKRMAEFAVDRYLKRVGRRAWPSRDPFDFGDMYLALDDDRPPHDEGRCEKCRQLGRSCWKK